MSPFLQRCRQWISCLVIVIAVMAVVIAPKFWDAPRPAGMPFGCFPIPGAKGVGMQDFAIHVHYLHCIWDRQMAHPYQLADQERAVHDWFPTTAAGFLHAYSPVTLVLAWPFLLVTPAWAFFLWTLINAALLLALTWGYLMPRLTNPAQGFALLALFCSYAVLDNFNMGQTAFFTTALCAWGYASMSARPKNAPLAADLTLAFVLYALSFKPSIAMVIYGLALSQRAWRPVLIAVGTLALTWLVLGPRYGGYIEGLKDYNWMLGHYCLSEMPVFFQSSFSPRGSTSLTSFVTLLNPVWNSAAFAVSRVLFEGLIVVVVVLGWRRRIGLPTAFQALVWNFLLFCPYLLLTEDFLLCLVIVDGRFFRNGLGGAAKAMMMIGVANVWIGWIFHFPLVFVVKLALAAWWLAETLAGQTAVDAVDGLRNPGQTVR